MSSIKKDSIPKRRHGWTDRVFRNVGTDGTDSVPKRRHRWNGQSVPKRRHIKFRRLGITHNK